jgi:hypothetical protein
VSVICYDFVENQHGERDDQYEKVFFQRHQTDVYPDEELLPEAPVSPENGEAVPDNPDN